MRCLSSVFAPAMKEEAADNKTIEVGLFVTCLVDLMRPNVGFAAVRLLEATGCSVTVPEMQSCCGQPAYNNGDDSNTLGIARQVIEVFENFDYVVAPSGSCAGMLREHYPRLFATDLKWVNRAHHLAQKTYELTQFLVDVVGLQITDTRYDGLCTYHDSCAGLRELGIKKQPRRLLSNIAGLELVEMKDTEICCGFGGTFSVKYPQISGRLAADKVKNADRTDADTLVGGDLGCLLNLAGRLSREGRSLKVFHVAEVLAGMAGGAAVGEAETDS